MDNLTHSLVGLAAAKAGLDRVSPYATAVCIIAANGPDADVVTLFAGQWTYLEHHRGITHSIIGTLVLAALWPALFYAGDRLVARVRRRPPRARIGGLLLASLIMSASHPLLDWTNNYGVRPFLPWDGRWIYGDLVFILDPWLWLSVGGAAFLLTATSNRRIAAWTALALLITAAIILLPMRTGMPYPTVSKVLWVAGVAGLAVAHRARLAARWGSSIAVVALALVVVYWGALALVHRRAVAQAESIAQTIAATRGETVLRVVATPMPADPLNWRCLAETNRATTRFDVSVGDSNGGATAQPRNVARFEKPEGMAAELAARASRDRRAEIFLGFARFPATRVVNGCVGETLVQFSDLRYTEPGGEGRGNFNLEVVIPPAPAGERSAQ